MLVGGRLLPAALRAARPAAGGHRPDAASRVLSRVTGGLPADRAAWGTAMLVELGQAHRASERWRFSLGCVRVVAAMRCRAALTRRDRGAGGLRAAVLGAVAAALGLAVYGLVRYPGLRSGAGAPGACVVLAVLLSGYAAAALTLSGGYTRSAALARRFSASGDLVVGATWVAGLAPPHLLKAWVFVPLLVALLAPAAVAALVGRAGRDARAATDAALWSGLVGGLLVFIVWVTETYAHNGRPYDAQLVRDFRSSGSHDLVGYAVSDNLGAALGLLVIIPTVALAVGSLVGRTAAHRGR